VLAIPLLPGLPLAAQEDSLGRLFQGLGAPLAYREGVARGEADARAGLAALPGRWNGTVSSALAADFAAGYKEGYARESGGAAESDRRFYEQGLRQGERDGRAGTEKDPSRYHNAIPREKRADFTRGYVEAYDREAGESSLKHYRNGLDQGARDVRNGVSKDPSRYHAGIPREKRADFTRGYVEAYDRESAGSAGRHYQTGLIQGARDLRKGLSRNPSRHQAAVPRERWAEFAKGYDEAYTLHSRTLPPAPQTPGTYENLGAKYAVIDQKAGFSMAETQYMGEVPLYFRPAFRAGYRSAWRPQPR